MNMATYLLPTDYYMRLKSPTTRDVQTITIQTHRANELLNTVKYVAVDEIQVYPVFSLPIGWRRVNTPHRLLSWVPVCGTSLKQRPRKLYKKCMVWLAKEEATISLYRRGPYNTLVLQTPRPSLARSPPHAATRLCLTRATLSTREKNVSFSKVIRFVVTFESGGGHFRFVVTFSKVTNEEERFCSDYQNRLTQ